MKLKISTAEQLSTHFKSLRKAKGWSQADLGKRIGLKQARVAQIEGDPGAISVDKLFQVLHALDADFVIETGDSDAEQANAGVVQSPHWTEALRKSMQAKRLPTLTEDLKQSLNLIPTLTRNVKLMEAFSRTPAPDEIAADKADTQSSGEVMKKTKD